MDRIDAAMDVDDSRRGRLCEGFSYVRLGHIRRIECEYLFLHLVRKCERLRDGGCFVVNAARSGRTAGQHQCGAEETKEEQLVSHAYTFRCLKRRGSFYLPSHERAWCE